MRGRVEAQDRATPTAPGGVDPRVDPAGVRPPERAGRLHIQPVLGCLPAALPAVDELDAGALPPRRPLAALIICVQQARVWISSLQTHPVHALHAGSDRPLGIPPSPSA